MSTTLPNVRPVHIRKDDYHLTQFEENDTSAIVSWVRDDRELFWLAPKTPPPLTAAKILAWRIPGGCPLAFYYEGNDGDILCGYVELNPMPAIPGHLWMGHCLVRPDLRGSGVGKLMVQLMLREAFWQRRARAVSLVVFPDNIPAIRCYSAVGFRHVGEQTKFFPTTGRQHCMLEMQITSGEYRKSQPSS